MTFFNTLEYHLGVFQSFARAIFAVPIAQKFLFFF